VTLVPRVGLIYGLPAQQVALETTATLATLLTGFLVFGRLQRNSGLDELTLVAALAVITLSNVVFVLVPMLTGSATVNATIWSAIIGRTVGGLLFAVAAFVPCVRLRRPRQALWLATMGVLGAVALTAILPRAFGSILPQAIMPSSGRDADYGLHGHLALTAAQVTAAAIAALAAAGFLRRSERLGDEFPGWLAIAAVFAAASHLAYAPYPMIYSPQVTLGDIFRFCFFVVLLIGSLREIRFYWRTLASMIVAEERRRIARDLHDGLAQELAYLTRNLSGLRGAADEKTLRQLQVSVERARRASRQAIARVAAPDQRAIADALTEAAGEVAERFGLDLELNLALDIGVAPARADALVGIACEALTNAARHSGSRTVSLMLRRDGGRVRMRVRDSGQGFDAAACREGYGLTSMRDRARSVGGELNISSEPGIGCQVEAMI
jgi:signal transduction histidine kinase